jgi:serine/threonine protein kinase
MTSDQPSEQGVPSYARVREVYLAVGELDGDARERAILRLCGEDATLRRKVVRMLDADIDESRFLAEPATLDGLPFLAESLAPPLEVGPYRIGELLGEGGFGSVYRARQDVPIRREVAIKLIKPGMDTRAVVARFEAERQTLALLQHPNVAQVFEAGATAEGRPYFVMELIEGQSITDFADARRLSIEARLALYLDVCRAVEHAHQKGVIHRDLKPSNVLVQERGGQATVKVIDFGIAKAIEASDEDAVRLTREAQLVGTPDYMSPEQAEGMRGADTRVDIYALGVLLYQLLTGSTPLGLASREGTSIAAILKSIQEEEPKRPSVRIASANADSRRLRARVAGDLDWIALRAIEKDRERRYASVGALIADIERHLAHQPVSAARPSAWYTLGKFVRRHRLGVSAVGAVIGSLGVGLAMTTLSLQRATQAESDLRLARDQAMAVNNFLVDDLLGSASSNRAGHTVTVVDAMKSAMPGVDQRFAQEPAVGARVKYAIGSVFRDIGLLDESVPPLKASVETLERELGPEHANTIDAKVALGDALRELGRDEEAEAMLRPAVAAIAAARGLDDPQTLKLKGSLGEILQKRGRHEEADALLRDTIERMVRVLPPTAEPLLAARISLVASLGSQARDEEALPYAKAILAQTKSGFPATHPAVLAAMNQYATILGNLGRFAEAEPVYRELLAALEASLPAGHWQIALTRYSLGLAVVRLGRVAEGLPLIEKAIPDASAALGPEHEFVKRMVADRDIARGKLERSAP